MDATTKLKEQKIKRQIIYESNTQASLESTPSKREQTYESALDHGKNFMRTFINQPNCVTKLNPEFLKQSLELIIILVGIENNFTTLVGK